MDEKNILLQTLSQRFGLPPTTDDPILDHKPNMETYPSTTGTQVEIIHHQVGTKPATVDSVHDNSRKLKMPTPLEEYESSHVVTGSELVSSPELTTTEHTESTDSPPDNTSPKYLAPPSIKMDNACGHHGPCETQQATPSFQTPPSNKLLRKAKGKHQLSLARLRVKTAYQNQEAKTMDHAHHTDSQEPSNGTETTTGSPPITNPEVSLTGIQESCEPKPMDQSQDGHEPTTLHSPTIPPGAQFVPSTPVIDFARFSQEQSLVFEAGPIGLQLEHCTADGNAREYPAKVVRFVDGGPHDPGPARRSGRIKPGDFVVRVEAEGVVGTTYYTILHLLQKSWTTRKLTFRSAWEPLHVATSLVSPNLHKKATTPITPRSTTMRSTPLKDTAPLPYQWTPLPYDWITKKRPQATTPEEQIALDQMYEEEASRIVRERDEQKRRTQAEAVESLHQNQSSWNFEDLVLGAVALTAESVAGCLRKQPPHDTDSDDDEGDHQKRD